AGIQIRDFEQALEMYRLDVGRYPGNEDGLDALVEQPSGVNGWNGPYLRGGELPQDPWGNPYHYRIPGDNGRDFGIISYGADTAPSGEGEDADISNEHSRPGHGSAVPTAWLHANGADGGVCHRRPGRGSVHSLYGAPVRYHAIP